MKIASAKCVKGDARNPDEYRATVEVSSDGVTFTGSWVDDNPDTAISRALESACGEFTSRLMRSVSTEIEVKF